MITKHGYYSKIMVNDYIYKLHVVVFSFRLLFIAKLL